ncbi:MAG: lysophospholipase, partial [Candidatus Brocadiae bacterium]|nr:lysophospholipase [Candidatus Brocadiia bacterium]
LVFVILSATPFPLWVYFAWSATVLAWLGLQEMGGTVRSATILRLLVLVACGGVALAELSYQLRPVVRIEATAAVYVIGDSISAGTGAGEKVWPQVLAEIQGRQVVNLARAGATARTAWVQADEVPAEASVVLVEIGGNDLLKGHPPLAFEADLRGLLARLIGRDRAIVMFELPLPPFHNRYGRIQRVLADEFGVTLLPKRLLAGVLAGRDSTLDGLHLSQQGHRQMAELMAGVLGS